MKNLFIATAGLIASISTPIIANATCTEHTSSNSAHVAAGRAYTCGTWNAYACAIGSDENLGLNNSFNITTMKEEGGVFSEGTCPVVSNSAPVINDSYALQVDDPEYTPQDIKVTDIDGDDLETLQVMVTNSRNDEVDYINCEFEELNAEKTEYRSTVCDTYPAPDWGTYAFTPIATDKYGNESEGLTMSQNSQVGSTAPTSAMSSYNLNGTVLTVTGIANDIDDDLDRIILGAGVAFGIVCEGTTNWTCTVETTDYFNPGQEVQFMVYARDSVENMSDIQYFTITTPEASGPVCVTATNADHKDAGRAELKFVSLYYALGSGNYLGLATNTTSLEEQTDGSWVKVANCN